MKAALHSRFGTGTCADNFAPSAAKRGEANSRTALARALAQREIVRNLAAASSLGVGEVLVYGAPNGQLETES